MWGSASRQRLLGICNRQQAVLEEAQEIINDLQATNDVLRQEMDRVDLLHARNVRDLIDNFIAAVDDDPDELRDGLEQGLSDLNDHVARLEEHSGI